MADEVECVQPQQSTVVLSVSKKQLEEVLCFTGNRAPVAHLVVHRAVTREVVSSTGPTLRVFK